MTHVGSWRYCAVNSSRSRWTLSILGLALLFLTGPRITEARLFVPMDLKQTDHLKAYGLAYWTLVNRWRR